MSAVSIFFVNNFEMNASVNELLEIHIGTLAIPRFPESKKEISKNSVDNP